MSYKNDKKFEMGLLKERNRKAHEGYWKQWIQLVSQSEYSLMKRDHMASVF